MDADKEFDALQWVAGALAWEHRLRQLESEPEEFPPADDGVASEVSRPAKSQHRHRAERQLPSRSAPTGASNGWCT